MDDTGLQRAFAATVKRLRLARGLSQEKFAALAGVDRTYVSGIERCRRNVTLATAEKLAVVLSGSLSQFLEQLLIGLDRRSARQSEENSPSYALAGTKSTGHSKVDGTMIVASSTLPPMTKYLTNPNADLQIVRGASFTLSEVMAAIDIVHELLAKFDEFDVDVFSLLGMRNLSAFVGEAFGAALVKSCGGRFVKNPHQDGYPDLLLLDSAGSALWEKLKVRKGAKEPFSPFAAGGVEIKATCGAVPTPKVLRKRGLEKPGLGDQRVSLLTGYDWKAHHRETNYLLGCFWDFVDGRPTICAVFYSRALTEDDWGKIVQPRAGGGRTTSVSIMRKTGIMRMYAGWVACLPDSRYAAVFDKRNGDTLMAQALREWKHE